MFLLLKWQLKKWDTESSLGFSAFSALESITESFLWVRVPRWESQERGVRWKLKALWCWPVVRCSVAVVSTAFIYNSVSKLRCARVPERQRISFGAEGGFGSVAVPVISAAYSRNYFLFEGTIWFNFWVTCLDEILRKNIGLSLNTGF